MHYFWKKDEANWGELGLYAYSNFEGAFVDTTTIPASRRLKIVLANGFNIGDETVSVSLNDSIKIIQRAAKRSFILFKGSIPVGWATFHRDHSYVPAEDMAEDNNFDINSTCYPEGFSSREEYVQYLKDNGLALDAPEKTEQGDTNIPVQFED